VFAGSRPGSVEVFRVSGEEGEEVGGDVSEEGHDKFGVSFASGSLSWAGSITPICRAMMMRAGPMPLPRVLRALPTTSGSIVHAGTGCAVGAAHAFGSRRVSSAKTWCKVRAAASRSVRPERLRQPPAQIACPRETSHSSFRFDPVDWSSVVGFALHAIIEQAAVDSEEPRYLVGDRRAGVAHEAVRLGGFAAGLGEAVRSENEERDDADDQPMER
jgi:hypothetical protein